jgi:transposase InsO family protein
LRPDNGGEYTSNKFKDFYKEERIKREMEISYNTQKNGVAEINNQCIIGSSRAMIHE